MESISATSLLGHRPVYGGYCFKDVSSKRKQADYFRLPFTEFPRGKVSFPTSSRGLRVDQKTVSLVKAQAMELTKEAYSYRENVKIPKDFGYGIDTGVDFRTGLWPPANRADNPALHNPLLRHERMGCGWLGAIFEWEGVLIEDNPDLESQAWLALAREERKSPPPAFMLGVFNVIVAADDVHRGKPDPEMFVYAAQLLQFIPERCIVFGNSNQTVEAAHDARMKCVAVASKHPVYELGAADLVVRHLDELSVVDLKNLADIESTEFGSGEPELEMEEEADRYPSPSVGIDDDFW